MARRWIALFLVVCFIFPAISTAQTAERIVTETGRMSLMVPEDWVIRFMPEEEEIQGIDSETLVMGTSDLVLDQFLDYGMFDGTVLFLSAYPYNIYSESVLGSAPDMLGEVTVHDLVDITRTTYSGYPGAEFLYTDVEQGIFIMDALVDPGELSYRVTIYSTRMDDYELVQAVLDSLEFRSPQTAFVPDQPTRQVTTNDTRLTFEIPQTWLYWVEGKNTLTFASSGAGYQGLSYSFQPGENHEIGFVVQRFIKSALRGDEILPDRTANLPAIATRLRQENGGLPKDITFEVVDWNGLPRLDAAWLVPGENRSIRTQTILLDSADVVYFIQAQYAAENSADYHLLVETIFQSMSYTPPAKVMDTAEVGLEPGQTAPDFTAPLLDGGEARLSDYQGEVVLMNMWASWCGPCHDEAPFLQSLYDEYAGRFEILAVNVGESEYEANGFARAYDLSFPVLLDPNEEVAQLYGLTAYPTTYVIGRDGVVLDMIRGSFTEQGLRDLLAIYVGR